MLRVLISLIIYGLAIAPSVFAKEYSGSAWVDDACKYYNGSAWVACTKKRYNGSAWAEIEATGGSVTPFFEADWTSAGATDELCSTTPCPDIWDTLYDPNSSASVSDGVLIQTITANTSTALLTLGNTAGQVIETFPDEYWYEYTVEFSRVDGFAANGYAQTSRNEHVSPAGTPGVDIKADASGVLNKVTVGAKSDSGTSYPLLNAVIAPVANTPFTVRFHWKKDTDTADTSNNGVANASVAGVVGSLTNIDSDTVTASKKISLMALTLSLHNGSNNFAIKYDNYKLYTTDPGWTW